MTFRNYKFQGVETHAWQPLIPQRTSGSYGSFDNLRLPSLWSPSIETATPSLSGSMSPNKGRTGRSIGAIAIFLILLVPGVAFIFFYDLQSMVNRYSKVKEELRKERERWEKAREDRVPQGAFWDGVWPAWDCRAYGTREYWGILQNIPKYWTDLDACMNMPVEIKGVTLRRPYRCAYVEGSPYVHGYWMVEWDQPDCQPWHRDFHDKVRGTAMSSAA